MRGISGVKYSGRRFLDHHAVPHSAWHNKGLAGLQRTTAFASFLVENDVDPRRSLSIQRRQAAVQACTSGRRRAMALGLIVCTPPVAGRQIAVGLLSRDDAGLAGFSGVYVLELPSRSPAPFVDHSRALIPFDPPLSISKKSREVDQTARRRALPSFALRSAFALYDLEGNV
jgi:hypothetical protein